MEFECGNIYGRPNRMMKGDVIDGHAHNFDHASLVLCGAVRIRRKDTDEVRELFAPTPSDDPLWLEKCLWLVEAGVEHEIEATVDNTAFVCIYAHRTPQGDVVQKFTGWRVAYV